MPITTITDLTADELAKLAFSKRLKAGASPVDLANDTKYAIVLVELHPTVTPDDYATLKTNLLAVSGIQAADLLIDHQTRASVPADHTQVLSVRADVTLRDDTPVPPVE